MFGGGWWVGWCCQFAWLLSHNHTHTQSHTQTTRTIAHDAGRRLFQPTTGLPWFVCLDPESIADMRAELEAVWDPTWGDRQQVCGGMSR